MLKFTKMHGTGNDYIYIEDLKGEIKSPSKLSVKMSNRNLGVGSDGLILILKSEIGDFKMRMFNADGSEAEMCGNGIRCFAKYVYDHGLTKKETVQIETKAGIKEIVLKLKNGEVDLATVNMGEPILQRERIPMLGDPGMVIDEIFHLDDGTHFNITSVSMGNPHAIIYVKDVDNFPVEKYGKLIENSSLFPSKTNVEFVEIINSKEVKQRTWERGSGETMACGTGASAVTVAGVLTKQTARKLKIHLRGGELKTEWDENTNAVFLTGPAVEVYRGEWLL